MSDRMYDSFTMHPDDSLPTRWFEQVVIRQLDQNDLEALEWDGEYLHFRRLFQDVYQRVRRGKAIMWGAVHKEVGLIGQAFVQLYSGGKNLAENNHRAYVHAFRVKPPFRGFGLGSCLLRVVENDLVQRGYRSITLNVARDNHDARRFYERHGFRIVSVEAGRWSYLDHKGRLRKVEEPSWRMMKSITETLIES